MVLIRLLGHGSVQTSEIWAVSLDLCLLGHSLAQAIVFGPQFDSDLVLFREQCGSDLYILGLFLFSHGLSRTSVFWARV